MAPEARSRSTPLDGRRGQPHLGAELRERGPGVLHERGDDALVQLVKGHPLILPSPGRYAADRMAVTTTVIAKTA